MAYRGKKQGVISGSINWNGKEFVEIFDQNFKYLYGEVDDLFISYGAWVEYDVVDPPSLHPTNCYKKAININMDVKTSRAPTTDEFGKKLMNVRDFNKVDFFQFDSQGDGNLTYKSAICRNFTNDTYYNQYYGEVILSRDSRNRLIEHNINDLDVMMTFIPSTKYRGVGPHWEVTHFIHQGKMYSINGYLSIRGFVLRGPGGVVRNRCDVYIPPDALRPKNDSHPPPHSASSNLSDPPKPLKGATQEVGLGSRGFGEDRCKLSETSFAPLTPRGFSSKGIGTFGFYEGNKSKDSGFSPEKESFGFGEKKMPESAKKNVVAEEQRPIRQMGFGFSNGSGKNDGSKMSAFDTVQKTCDVHISPDALRPKNASHPTPPSASSNLSDTPKPLKGTTQEAGLGSRGFGEDRCKLSETSFAPLTPRGFSSKGLGTFGFFEGNTSKDSGFSLEKESFGFGEKKMSESPKKNVVAEEQRPIRQMGFGFSNGSGKNDGSKMSVFDTVQKTSTNPLQRRKEKKVDDDDDWGDSVPVQRAQLSQFNRSRILPPQVKAGLAKYSPDQVFFN